MQIRTFFPILLLLLLPLYTQAQWTPVGGPSRPDLKVLVAKDSTILMSCSGGLFIWQPASRAWQPISLGPERGSVGHIIIDGNRWYVLVTNSNPAITNQPNILFSDNRGISWTTLISGTGSEEHISSFVVAGDSILIAGYRLVEVRPGYYGFQLFQKVSFNGGVNWEAQVPVDIQRIFKTAGGLVASTRNGNRKSLDWGKNWEILQSPTPFANTLVNYNGTIIVEDPFEPRYFQLSPAFAWDTIPTGDQHFTLLFPKGDTLYGIDHSENVFSSANRGETWEFLSTGVLFDRVVTTENAIMGFSEFDFPRLTVSHDGGRSFQGAGKGLEQTARVTGLAITENCWYMWDNNHAFRSLDKGKSWQFTSEGTSGVRLERGPFNRIVSLKVENRLRYSEDCGETWEEINFIFNSPATLAVNDSGIVVGPVFGLWFARAEGRGFKIEYQAVNVNTVVDLLWPDSRVIVADVFGDVWMGENNGRIWKPINYDYKSQLKVNESYQVDLANFGSEIILYANSYGSQNPSDSKIFRLDTQNQRWIPFPLPNNGNIIIRSLEGIGSGLFVGTLSHGLFLTRDLQTWESLDEGLPSVPVSKLTTHDQYLYVGLGGGGIYRRSLAELLVSEKEPEIQLLKLFVAPNPAREEVRLSWPESLPEPCTVRLFNSRGQLLAIQIAKGQECIFSLTTVPPGIYTLQVSAGSQTVATRFVKM